MSNKIDGDKADKEPFLTKHVGAMLALLSTIVLNVCLFAYAYGNINSKVETGIEQLHKIDQFGTATSQQNTNKIIEHDRRITSLEARAEKTADTLAEIKSDLRMVAEWVKEQKLQDSVSRQP